MAQRQKARRRHRWPGSRKPARGSQLRARIEDGVTTHSIPAGHLRLKRVYEPAASEDGVRILVDRLWPRGLSKADAAIDHWIKEVAPSTELRQWFG
ncbi:MAG: DUF488 family protein, partial [Acetobacteraceae bacterium]|nr:DUF488 family protein [Acetobacteraceae bacterium]